VKRLACRFDIRNACVMSMPPAKAAAAGV
jgi:hypothetical protein